MTGQVIQLADWQRGLTIQTLMDQMDVNQAAMRRRVASVKLSKAEQNRLMALNVPRRILVLTEEWCSDCLMNLPILVHIAEASPNLELRFFVRKDWPDLRLYFNIRDIFSLPTVQVMDENFLPLGVWIERPQAAHQRLAEWKAANPEMEHTRRRADLTSDQKREMMRAFNDRLLGEMESWYDQGLQSETIREVTDLLAELEKTPQG